MNRFTSKFVRLACLYWLLALAVSVLASPASAVAQATPADAQTRPESPSQVKPVSNTVQGSPTFTPAKPGTTPGGTAAGGTNTNKEK
jgi:hypothetical protein